MVLFILMLNFFLTLPQISLESSSAVLSHLTLPASLHPVIIINTLLLVKAITSRNKKKQAQTVGPMRLPKAQFKKQKLLLGNQNTKILLSEQWETFQWATKPCPGKLVKRSRTVSFFIHHKNLHVHLYERCKQSASLQVK